MILTTTTRCEAMIWFQTETKLSSLLFSSLFFSILFSSSEFYFLCFLFISSDDVIMNARARRAHFDGAAVIRSRHHLHSKFVQVDKVNSKKNNSTATGALSMTNECNAARHFEPFDLIKSRFVSSSLRRVECTGPYCILWLLIAITGLFFFPFLPPPIS